MSHTALPWKVVENAHRLIESSVTLDTVANAIVLGNYVKQGMSIKQAIDKAAENAEFIVTAVNAHEALTQRVAALEEALRAVTPPVDAWWCPTCHRVADQHEVTFEEYHETCGTSLREINTPEWVIKARKALEGK